MGSGEARGITFPHSPLPTPHSPLGFLVTRGNRELRAVGYGRIPHRLSILVNKLPCEPQSINSRIVPRRDLHENLREWADPYQPSRRFQSTRRDVHPTAGWFQLL